MDQQRFDAASPVLWLVAALNLLAGVPLLVVGATEGDAEEGQRDAPHAGRAGRPDVRRERTA